MTDNRTTELREKLTERGIEYTTNDHMGVCETSWNGFTAMQLTPSAKLIMTVTPEQAIAATLGNMTATVDDALSLLDEMNEQGRIEYADYSQLHDTIAATLGSEREIELGNALNEVAEKWAIAQVEAEDCSKRCMLLEELVRDMWRTLSAMYQLNLGIDIGKEHDYEQRIAVLGIEVIDE